MKVLRLTEISGPVPHTQDPDPRHIFAWRLAFPRILRFGPGFSLAVLDPSSTSGSCSTLRPGIPGTFGRWSCSSNVVGGDHRWTFLLQVSMSVRS